MLTWCLATPVLLDNCDNEPDTFMQELAQAKLRKDWKKLKALLVTVAESNYARRNEWRVPRTIAVPYSECSGLQPKSGGPAKVTFSQMSTADALLHFASQRGSVVCGLNFANGEKEGGGYKSGATAQEEDLCRRIPTLYTSLHNAVRDGCYPFGPVTCRSPERPEKYADVLYTTSLKVARAGEEDGFALLPQQEQREVSLVAAAAPNIKFRREVNDYDLMFRTIEAIFKAPKYIQPEVNTLILGAWGCGAFGGDPKVVSELFGKALFRDNLGQLYKEVHFAIPKTSPEDRNYDSFLAYFKRCDPAIQELQ